jgi:hypothetical protein
MRIVLKSFCFASLLLVAGFSCREDISVFSGTTYFEKKHIRRTPANALFAGKKAFYHFEGVYLPFCDLADSPALFFISPENTVCYIPLNKALPQTAGDYVAVDGTVVEKTISLNAGVESSLAVLSVSRSATKWQTHQFINQIQTNFQRAKEAVQMAMALPESQLKLPDSPQWLLVVDASRSRLIAYFIATDRMYSAEVNLVYDLASNQLVEVYADQWFKGE